MLIYFIRHGQSVQTDQVFQTPSTSLSEVGTMQAHTAARELESIAIDVLVSSPYKRALETAQAIEKTINIPIIQNNLFTERKMPTSFEGKPVGEAAISLAHQQIRQNFFNADWHHEDEENFFDLQARARTAREWLVAQNKEAIAVVTHGYFLAVLVYDILFGKTENYHLFRQFKKNTEFSNGRITTVEYGAQAWKIMSVNGGLF